MGVGQYLDLDVPSPFNEPFDVDFPVAKGCQGFAPGTLQRIVKILRLVDAPHPLAAAARRCLDQQRVADIVRGMFQFFIIQAALGAGHDRHPGACHRLSGNDLIAHCCDGIRRWADEGDSFVPTGLCKLGPLRQESVARVNGIRLTLLSRLNDVLDHQVAVAGCRRADTEGLGRLPDVLCVPVCIGVDGNSIKTQFAAGADQAHGDLTPVGNQDFAK